MGLVVSCALDTTVTDTAMPLGDPCSLPCLSWTACVTLDKSWTPSKPQMGENSRVPVAAVQELVSEQSQPQMVPRDSCIQRVPAVDPHCNKDFQMQWKKTVKPNKLDSRRKYIAGLSPLLFFLC